jgi:NTP pyrophosphatase (non-canonical NTP hydrolase)
MTNKEYEQSVLRTFKSFDETLIDGQDMELLHGALLLTGEAGEFADAVKKYIIYKQPADIVNMMEELGDILYGVTAMSRLLGVDLDYLMAINKQKLEQRYPTGYSDEAAKTRADKQEEEVDLGDPLDWVWINEGDRP